MPDTPRDLSPSDIPGTRPYGPPLKAGKRCAYGVLGSFVGVLGLPTFQILFWLYGDNWIGVFMPYGIPVGPIIWAVSLALFGRYFVFYVYNKATIGWVRAFRIFTDASTILFLIFAVVIVYTTATTINEDIFATQIALSLMLIPIFPFQMILFWTVHKYRWYDPKSRPSEWELPETLVQKQDTA